MSFWSAVIPIAPMATPRPKFHSVINGDSRSVVTYYDRKYTNYQNEVHQYLEDHALLNEDFFETMKSPMGVLAEIVFYVKVAKDQKQITSLMRTTAPDIDNLSKGIIDSIFMGLKIRDSRIVGLNAIKMNEKDYPRTEVRFVGINDE